jgi:hypothetical protein
MMKRGTSLLSWRLKPNIWICRRTSPRANSSHRTEFGTSRSEQFLTGLTWKELALGLAHKLTVLTELYSELAAYEQFLTKLALKIRTAMMLKVNSETERNKFELNNQIRESRTKWEQATKQSHMNNHTETRGSSCTCLSLGVQRKN